MVCSFTVFSDLWLLLVHLVSVYFGRDVWRRMKEVLGDGLSGLFHGGGHGTGKVSCR